MRPEQRKPRPLLVVVMSVIVIMVRVAARITNRRSRRRAAALLRTVIHALQQARILGRASDRRRSVELLACLVVTVALIEAKFGLYGGAVDAVCMQTLSHALGEDHVLLAAGLGNRERDLDVQGCDNLGVRELPDVHMMTGDDARQRLYVLANVCQIDILGCGL